MLTKRRKRKILAKVPGRVGRLYQSKLDAVEAFEATQRRFVAALQECTGMYCIDIGANVGDYTRTMAMYASYVYAIEPDPVAFDILTSVTKGLSNVIPINACGGISDAKTRIYRTKEFQSNPRMQTQGSSMFLSRGSNPDDAIESDQVNVIELIQSLESEVGVIKIDAEGAEIPILESILEREDMLKRIRYVFAETHEHIWPELQQRYGEIRRRAAGTKGAIIDLSWH